MRLEEATFEKDGRSISYRKASLTHEGEEFSDRDAELVIIRQIMEDAPRKGRSRSKSASSSGFAAAGGRSAGKASAASETALSPAATALEERLRAWRKAEASKIGQPAFCVFSDKTLRLIASDRPVSEDDLLAISGVGPAKVAKFGPEVCRICAEA